MGEPIAEPTGLELILERRSDSRFAVIANGAFSHAFDLTEVALTPARFEALVQDPRPYGRRLFAALFPPRSPAQEALAHLRRASGADGALLLVSQDPQAQAVPWEYLYDGDDFLGLTHHLMRGIPQGRRQGYGAAMPAEALYLVAVPSDPLLHDGRPVPELDVRGELERLRDALQKAGAPYRATFLAPASLDALHKALAPRGRQTIIHFIGHCQGTEEGAVLLFEDETAVGRQVTARELIGPVGGQTFLVFVNACESAMTLETPVSNLAYNLAVVGVPYALGMQFTISDPAALRLSEFFYTYLAQGHPLEEALRQARLALRRDDNLAAVRLRDGSRADLRPFAMGIPVLYTSLWRGLARFQVRPGEAVIEETRPQMAFEDQLAETAFFRGRRKELAEIGRRLRDGAKVVTLAGTGGIGKSALARRAAQRFAWRFRAGVLGLSLETLPPRDHVLARLGRWLLGEGFARIPPQERADRVATAFKEEARLLVLDNYESLLDGLEAGRKEAQARGSSSSGWWEERASCWLPPETGPPSSPARADLWNWAGWT